MRSLLYFLSFLVLASTTILASPAFSRYSDVTLARRAFVAGGARETNAQRMKRGLNPKRPDRLFSPSHVRRDPLPSSVPVIPIKIKLVKKSDGLTAGYMRSSYDPISPTDEGGMRFLLNQPVGTSPSRKFEILYDPTAIGEGILSNLNVYSPATPTPEGSVQVNDGYVKYESTIWSVDLSTGVLSAQWVNPDRTTAPLHFIQYDAGGDSPFSGATGGVQVYKDADPALSLEGLEVTLVAVPVTLPEPDESQDE